MPTNTSTTDNVNRYAPKTTFTYITDDGKERIGISMRTGKIVDSIENKTYSSLKEWLENLPGSPSIDKINIKEPETKKKTVNEDGLKKKEFNFKKLCPTYDMALLLFAHEQHNLDDSISYTSNKYKTSNIYAEDHNGDLVIIHYNRWKVIMSRNSDSDDNTQRKLESVYFEGIGIKPDTKLYILSNCFGTKHTSTNLCKMISYKPPFTKENWKEYISRPFIFYYDNLLYDTEKQTLKDTFITFQQSDNGCNIINLDYFRKDSITTHGIIDKCITFYANRPYTYYSQGILKHMYYIGNHKPTSEERDKLNCKCDNFEEALNKLKTYYNSIISKNP
jgi:hypothetical protein